MQAQKVVCNPFNSQSNHSPSSMSPRFDEEGLEKNFVSTQQVFTIRRSLPGGNEFARMACQS